MTFTGARCTSGQALQVNVDPGNQIDETNKADNTRSIAC